MANFDSLHDAQPDIDDDLGYDWSDSERNTASNGAVAHFGDLTGAAIRFIEESPAVVGCIAWLTETRLLAALATRPVAIVVQKEDFLRPDPGSGGSPSTMRRAYDRLHNDFTRYEFPVPLRSASYASDPTLSPVRCVGNHNSAHASAMPRMHHKFLVRVEQTAHAIEGTTGGWEFSEVRPLAVWTGSFNFSYNGGRSFENALEITDPEIASAYLQEFARVATLSEPLDWTAPWVQSEWRIGS